jgi:hypothetical protein
MAIFGRRTTQRLIDETAFVITRRQIKKIVDDLNAMPDRQTLSPDWELLLLNVFSKIGRVGHEHSFGGNTKPDLFFECRSHHDIRFVADIRTVSDKGFKDANPFGALLDAMQDQYYDKASRRMVISARILLELLAGRMSYEAFAQRYGFVAVDPFPSEPNPFALSLQNGALIRDVRFQKGGSEVDDDAVIIELSDEADPAISPFRYRPKITSTISGG